MDGLKSWGQVILIGATNRVDSIDGAFWRPGKFDREFNFSLPSLKACAKILGIHTRRKSFPNFPVAKNGAREKNIIKRVVVKSSNVFPSLPPDIWLCQPNPEKGIERVLRDHLGILLER
ncbi:hypothetical protein LguiB_001860 [Lonicera macranthoides]